MDVFGALMQANPKLGKKFMDMALTNASSSALDRKTFTLAYLSVLAAKGLHDGLDYHVKDAKDAGATREEVKSAIILGLPCSGVIVLTALDKALEVYDNC